MLRLAIVVLVTVEILLLTALALPSANATTGNLKNYEQYIWSYDRYFPNQRVCKKVIIRPEKIIHPRNIDHAALKIDANSEIVADRFCE